MWLWLRGFNAGLLVQIIRNLFGLMVTCKLYNSCMHSHDICICTRVAAAAEEVVFEVVAKPQEPLEQALQEERREN